MRSEMLKTSDEDVADVELELSPLQTSSTTALSGSADHRGTPHVAPSGSEDGDEDRPPRPGRPTCVRAACDAVRWVRGWPRWVQIGTVLALLGFVALAVLSADPNTCLFVPVTIAALADPTDLLPAGRAAPTAAAKAQREFILTLLGDSYLIDPEWNWQFNAKIKRFLGAYNVTVFNHGRRGERIKDVKVDTIKIFRNLTNPRVRAEGVWEPRLPDAVIVMTGSDVNSEIPWEYGTADYAAHQAQYLVDYQFVLDMIRQAGVPVAVASPATVITEGPLLAPDSARFHNKRQPSEDYCRVTAAFAARNNIPYIDVHGAFLRAIPPYRLCYRGCVTRDGEHPSAHGADIMARMFTQVAVRWFYAALVAEAQ